MKTVKNTSRRIIVICKRRGDMTRTITHKHKDIELKVHKKIQDIMVVMKKVIAIGLS